MIGLTSQIRRRRSNAYSWNSYALSPQTIISQTGMAADGYWPDGKLMSGKDGANFMMYWPERGNYRTVNVSPYPEDHKSQVIPANNVFGQGVSTIPGFSDNGTWFIGVHRVPNGDLVGFFHAESAWGGLEAYKSIGVAYSTDNGLTWTAGEKVLAADYPKPAVAQWSGIGDGTVVWNENEGKWICYYSALIPSWDYMICMASSDDPLGAQGTWYKWDGSDFTVDGYDDVTGVGGADKEITGLSSRSGANPSVMWNTFLGKWVMVYAGWDNAIYMSASDDGISWESPIQITSVGDEDARYPNLIGAMGDEVGGKTVKMYYGRNQNPSDGTRQLAVRELEWIPVPPDPNLPLPITTEDVYEFAVAQPAPAMLEVTNMPIGATIEWWAMSLPPGGINLGTTNPVEVNPVFLANPITVQGYVRFNQGVYSSEWKEFTINVS